MAPCILLCGYGQVDLDKELPEAIGMFVQPETEDRQGVPVGACLIICVEEIVESSDSRGLEIASSPQTTMTSSN